MTVVVTAPVAITGAVTTTLERLDQLFEDTTITATPDGSGGAYVVIDAVDLGRMWTPRISWFGFHLNCLLPDSDVYPLYVDAAAKSTAGLALPCPPYSVCVWQGRPALQVSRASRNRAGGLDSAELKITRVLTWLRGCG